MSSGTSVTFSNTNRSDRQACLRNSAFLVWVSVYVWVCMYVFMYLLKKCIYLSYRKAEMKARHDEIRQKYGKCLTESSFMKYTER